MLILALINYFSHVLTFEFFNVYKPSLNIYYNGAIIPVLVTLNVLSITTMNYFLSFIFHTTPLYARGLSITIAKPFLFSIS